MAVVLGTNSGFVTVAPTSDPGAFYAPEIDDNAFVTKDTSPETAIKITEIGWWCDNATEEANFEVGLYAADGEVVPGEAGTLLYSDTTNAKGTTAGWKSVAVDWEISGNTVYWLGVQLDNTATATATNHDTNFGSGNDFLAASIETLPNPFGGGALSNANGKTTLYAVWEAEAPTTGGQDGPYVY